MSKQDWHDWAARTLERRSLVEPPESVVRRAAEILPGRRRGGLPNWMAAAAILIVGVAAALLVNWENRPALPDRSTESALRSGEVVLSDPLGSQDAMPTHLRWEPDHRAQTYKVTLHAVDDVVLFETTTSETEAALPQALRESLHPAVTYSWSVEAVDANGRTVARSQREAFAVRP